MVSSTQEQSRCTRERGGDFGLGGLGGAPVGGVKAALATPCEYILELVVLAAWMPVQYKCLPLGSAGSCLL